MTTDAPTREKRAGVAARRPPRARSRGAGAFGSGVEASRPAGEHHARRPVRECARDEARGAYREAILSAAERVFARSGFHATRMADVAREAGVGVGTLYNYFESKEVIFSDLLELRHRELRRAVDAAAVAADPVERLQQIVRSSFTAIGEKGELLAVFLERGAASENDMERLIGDCAARQYGEFLSLLEKTVREAVRAGKIRGDVEPRLIVSALSGAMNGAIYSWLERGRRGRLSSVADALFDIFLQGAGSSKIP